MFIFVLKTEMYDNLDFMLEFRFLEWQVMSFFKYVIVYIFIWIHMSIFVKIWSFMLYLYMYLHTFHILLYFIILEIPNPCEFL